MPNNITDVSTFTSPIQTVADGDAANAADFALAPQGLSNRTKYLYDEVVTNGVRFLRTVASTAALAALTGVVDGERRVVQGYGIYTYTAASAATVDGFLVINATGMGSGRWLHIQQSQANQNGGFAVIGTAGASTGRIPASVVPNGTVQIGVGKLTGTFTPPTGSSWIDVTGTTNMSFTWASAQAGDIILIDAQWLFSGSAAGVTQVRLAVVDGGTTNALSESVMGTPTNTQFMGFYGSMTTWTVANTGSVTVKGQWLETSTAVNIVAASSLVRAVFVRP